jgi:glucosamine-6-phosphate deaminase
MKLQIEADAIGVARESARLVAAAIRNRPGLTVAFPTGSTPLPMYEELVRFHQDDHLDFSGVRVFSLDEYVGMAESDPRSFRRYLWTQFLGSINVRPANVLLAPSAENEADGYEQAIRASGGIDLLIAGLGTNGHIAFNEPGSSFESRTRQVDLAESTLAGMRARFSEADLPKQAITMGVATILEARQIVMLVVGEAKKAALHRMIEGPVSEATPASALQRHGDVTIFADQSAWGTASPVAS